MRWAGVSLHCSFAVARLERCWSMTLVSAENEAGQGCQRRTKESSATAQIHNCIANPHVQEQQKELFYHPALGIQK